MSFVELVLTVLFSSSAKSLRFLSIPRRFYGNLYVLDGRESSGWRLEQDNFIPAASSLYCLLNCTVHAAGDVHNRNA